MGTARRARPSDRLRAPLERADRDRHAEVRALAGRGLHKFYDWRARYGQVNEHNGRVPRDFWLENWEKRAIVDFHDRFPLEGYRRLTFMMLDADVVAVSPASVWRGLHQAGRLARWKGKPSNQGKGFQPTLRPHQ